MTSSKEPFPDEQAAIEHALLWDDITTTVRQHANEIGIRPGTSEDSSLGNLPTRFVLESDPQEGTKTLLWARATNAGLIGEVTISTIQESETSVEQYMYEITPACIIYYGRQDKKTCFGRDEIEELRADFREITWNPGASQSAGENAIFWEV